MSGMTQSIGFGRLSAWLLRQLSRPGASLLSLASGCLVLVILWAIVDWLVLSAVPPLADPAGCAEAAGACWPFWAEKSRFILFGTYPFDEQWRPMLASLLLLGLSIATGQMAVSGRWLDMRLFAGFWLAGMAASFTLMGGGILGLVPVDATKWNGLPILIILSTIALALALPVGVLLALARYQTRHRLLHRAAGAYVEIMRGVPMVTLLFVGVFVLPLTLPKGMAIDPIVAVLIALVFFHSAYFAEDVRSGLMALPAGQHEAASSLGLGFWQTARLVLLPQATERAMPALVNSTIGAYKDTSLVVILGLHDLSATARMAFSDVAWGNQALEAYVFVGVWFLISCSYLSWIGRRLAAQSAKARRRSD
ncbi:amino acid ABC transporter permease [Ensifer sp. SSB1]|uniref:amino acid ABC transporter permease n=1 Tax=Ensifer sp. SSB1 TaxID=2795385 RepID=UPI001A4CBF4C|nr:amino acid ABC transporter permease [Ensifer sp. SSB1]MBK5566204.1 amino acid ABC transporter permease [Ensifer sp. SSB1]